MTHHPTFQGSASSSIQSQATRGIAVAVRRFFHSDTFTAPTMWFSPVKFCSWTMMDLHSGTSWDLMGHTSLNKSHSSARTLCRCLHLPSMKLDQRNILLLRSFPQLVQSCSPHVGVKPLSQGCSELALFGLGKWSTILGHRLWPSALSTSRAVRPQLLTA